MKEDDFLYSKIKSKPPFNILLKNGCLHLLTYSFHSYYTHMLSIYVTDCVIVTKEYKWVKQMQFLLHGNSQSYREEDIKTVLFYFNYTKDCKRSEGKECSHMGSLRYIYCGIQIILYIFLSCLQGFPGSSAGKESTCRAGDAGSVPVSADPLKKG